jgi:hypothetical protein
MPGYRTGLGLDLGVGFLRTEPKTFEGEDHVGLVLDLEGADAKDQLSDEADSVSDSVSSYTFRSRRLTRNNPLLL